jgi:hypothetical protein
MAYIFYVKMCGLRFGGKRYTRYKPKINHDFLCIRNRHFQMTKRPLGMKFSVRYIINTGLRL